MPAVTKSFSYDPERDPDVHEWMGCLSDRRGALSEAILRAIRCQIRAADKDLAANEALSEILIKLERIEGRLSEIEGGERWTSQTGDGPELPPDVLAALSDLGDR
jgi:hypothetical protein